MIHQWLTLLNKYASGKILILLFMALIPFNLLIFPAMQMELSRRALTSDAHMLDVQIGYTAEQALDEISQLGVQGKQWYRLITWTADLVYPALYSTFFALLLAFLLRVVSVTDSRFSLVPLVPFLMALMDYGENIAITVALSAFSQPSEGILALASVLSALKWACGIVILLFVVLLLFYLLFRMLKKMER
ncbi:hypothetical protein [Anaerolinea thermophila]|uniref:Hypothetical membrane protein n=1 Tax=Anaerolinea thermophila (strain DSM 14523 / JCM 11388 / NBRC 100420 / UNI-1) TaxID=926569 RepID=E8N508_ANATU|nr:hypothetical protein [Anaerolinea thermophila]BAJ63522.1 hypothetical membrane protein [Anaerolinea thermophila UNI-1]